MKRFSFLLAVLCTLGLTASAAVGDEFTLSYPSGSSSYNLKYVVTGESPATVKTVEQSDYHTSMPEGMAIVVPQTVTHEGVEYTVTAVGDKSFYGWKGVSFVLPGTVTSLGREAFSKAAITEIVLPGNLTYIGEYCFSESSLQSVVANAARGKRKHGTRRLSTPRAMISNTAVR